MGSITPRKRNDGTIRYDAQIVIKRQSRIVHRETKGFDREQAARAWLGRREHELEQPGALDRPVDPPLRSIIDRYINESERELGRTKTQVLNAIKRTDLADMHASKIGSDDVVAMLRTLKVQPQTRQSYLSHLGSVFTVARPAWKYPLDPQVIRDTAVVTKKLGLTKKGNERTRRPELSELDLLMVHYDLVQTRRSDSVPMQKVIAFAIFSTRRQEEITKILWDDLDEKNSRVLVRDMKNPGDKQGNHVLCDLPPEALAVILSMPRTDSRIFPYHADTISASFTRATAFLEIDDLHFHDLRHEGISRLFEMGRTIPQAATVSGHRSWASLKRYSHIRQSGDKYAGWRWLRSATAIAPNHFGQKSSE